ncbi:MAG: GatB/YqeY domain-containing protein [Gammaproteobacteria bacterium]|nr:GatB/YqeY domain-containing protein [Gammaproteobacteria bacterium]
MSLKDTLTNDMKTAMKAGDKDRLKVVRLLLADIKRVEVDTRKDLDDAAILSIIEKAVKQRRDSIEQFTAGKRDDLADIEKAELVVIQNYLPEALSDDELDALITAAIAESGADSIRDMGKVMGAIKSKAAGRADMGAVGAKVKARLA